MDPELRQVVENVCKIIDEPPSIVVMLLEHFHWHPKPLIEQYLEDARAVRREMGLHPRSYPPFLRFDVLKAVTEHGHGGATMARSASATLGCFQMIAGGKGEGKSEGKDQQQHQEEDVELMCKICFCPMESDEAFALACEHWFCTDCWGGHLSSRIKDGIAQIRCPGEKCRMLVCGDMIEFMCTPDVVAEHQAILRR